MGNDYNRPIRRAYKTPTEDAAIGNILREERKKKRREARKQAEKKQVKRYCRHRTRVWRAEDTQKETEVISHAGE